MAWAMVCLAVCMLAGLGLSASADDHKATIISFDAPGAAAGTHAWVINDRGVIMGWYLDENYSHHTYVRAPNGQITTFDVPTAASGYCLGTNAWGLNKEGGVTGTYEDANDAFHGFLRTPHGTITTFDVPDAGTAGAPPCNGQGTVGVGINEEETSTGMYSDANWVSHGYVRTRDGKITTFDAPGAGTGTNQGTTMNQWLGTTHPITPAGAITGWYIDGNNVYHGFLRDPHGRIKTFDAPGAGTGEGQGTMVGGINPEGAIVGQYGDASDAWHSYLRAPDGTFTRFDIPGEGNAWTTALDINPKGEITGFYYDASTGLEPGFLRHPDGSFTTFNVPGALATLPSSINSAGAITGFWVDGDNAVHGFLRIPGDGEGHERLEHSEGHRR